MIIRLPVLLIAYVYWNFFYSVFRAVILMYVEVAYGHLKLPSMGWGRQFSQYENSDELTPPKFLKTISHLCPQMLAPIR